MLICLGLYKVQIVRELMFLKTIHQSGQWIQKVTVSNIVMAKELPSVLAGAHQLEKVIKKYIF